MEKTILETVIVKGKCSDFPLTCEPLKEYGYLLSCCDEVTRCNDGDYERALNMQELLKKLGGK